MSARSARRLVARAVAHGAILATRGDDTLVPGTAIPDDLRDAIQREFGDVFALVADAEDREAAALIARAASRFGWGRDDCKSALAAVDRDARAALEWLRWCASGGDVRSLVKDLKPTTGRATSKRRETTR